MSRKKRPAGPARCGRCGAPVAFWRSALSDSWLCVDLSPDDDGRIEKVVSGGTVYGRRLSGIDLAAAKADGQLLFLPHSATCSARRRPVSGRRPAHLNPAS